MKITVAWIEDAIKSFINKSPDNNLKTNENEKAWNEPIIGFSSAADPLYLFYKKDIGNFYLLPREIFAHAFPKTNFKPEQLTVISWILPHTEKTKNENRKQTQMTTERWARARSYGEEVNNKLRKHIINKLQEKQIKAVAPLLSPLYKSRQISKKYGRASRWSERHAAYASGLGTFGLCDGLITPKGKAMRCGSVIAHIKITPNQRPYNNHNEYCLFYMKGICGVCMSRCPAGAITAKGHDKKLCSDYVNKAMNHATSNFIFQEYVCGLCQTSVPCESKIPTKEEMK